MERSTSPLHVHVGKKTPVHVHIKPSRKASRLNRSQHQKLSCSEMSAGRPSLRASSGVSPTRSSSLRMKSSSSSRPWVPPPAKASKTRMSWEGPTHRLEINPVGVDPSGSTVLRVSDLSGDESTEILVEDSSRTIQSLQTEVDHLRAEADLQRSLRDIDIRDTALRESRASLREKEVELATYREELLETELENVKLKNSVARMSSPVRSSYSVENKQKERLLQKLVESEMDCTEVTRQASSFRDAVRKLQRDKRFSSVYAKAISEKKELLLEKLAQFETSNKSLRKLLRGQHGHESSINLLQEQTDTLKQQLADNEVTIHLLRSKLDEQEKLTMHSQGLHDEIGYKEGEIQSLNIRLQSIEEKLHQKELRCVELETQLREEKRRNHHDKDLLKKATRQHKDRAAQSEHTVETLGAQLDETSHELEQVRGKLMKSTRESITQHSEMRTLNDKVSDLEEALAQARVANKASLDATNARLAEKTHELNSVQMENDRLQVVIASLEGRLKVSESKAVAMDSEVAQLTAKIAHYEGLVVDYKNQLDHSHRDCDELNSGLRRKEVEMERAKQENTIEVEKLRLKHQHELAEYEPMPDMVKTTELRLKDAQERLLAYEQRAAEQTRMLAELSSKSQQHDGQMDSLREKWHYATAENKTLSARLDAAEKRLVESDEHNRELMSITSRKEETVQRLQGKIEELTQEVASLSGQLEDSKSEAKRHSTQIKDRAASKERANLARISDLESQLSRANGLTTQFRKAKEESDRRYHSRVHELQDRLDQANTTKRSLENYVNFLKSSYATVFNDSGTPGSPLPL